MRIRLIKSSIAITLVLMVGVMLSACSEQRSPIRLGTNVWPGYEPLYLARSIELLDEEKIRLIAYPSASEVIRAFRNGSLEAASLTLDEALLLLEKGIPIKIVLVHDISVGADVIVARPEIAEVADLKGRTVGVESSALGAYAITRALQQHGLTIDQVRIRHLDVNQHEAAYRAGEIDAAVTFAPFSTRLSAMGAHEIFSSREIPGEIVDVLVVHENVFKTRLPELQHLTRAWFKALQHLENQPREAAELMAQRLQLTPDEVLASYQGIHLPDRSGNVDMLNGKQAQLSTTLRKLNQVMLEHKLIRDQISIDRILTGDALF